jgi:hypothetical protein
VHSFRVEDQSVGIVLPSTKENVAVTWQVTEFHMENVGTNTIAQLTCRVCDRYKDSVAGDPLLKENRFESGQQFAVAQKSTINAS